jgi:hypothetical protein
MATGSIWVDLHLEKKSSAWPVFQWITKDYKIARRVVENLSITHKKII